VLDLAAAVDELWKNGVGPDDRQRIQGLMDDLHAPGSAAGRANAAITAAGFDRPPIETTPITVTEPARTELALFYAILDLMQGSPVSPPVLREGPVASLLLAAAVQVWAGAIARDPDKLERALGNLERALAVAHEPDDPRFAIAQAYADLALGEAALAAADRTSARHRLEAVARGTAPVPLRIAATLRIVTLLIERVDLEQARSRCRQAASLADAAKRPMHAHHARVTSALLDFMAGDKKSARKTLTDEIAKGPLGLLPRILLSSFEPAERAIPLLAEGLAEAGERGDPFAFTICTLVGARRYAALDKDADALLVLTTGIMQLRAPAPTFAATLDDERTALRNEWGPERYAAAEQGAIALLDGKT
jgi:hypothetical protein